MAAFAGLDVGTTSSKAVVYGADGAVLGTGRAATTWDAGPHGTETDAEVLWRSAFDALSAAAEAAGVPVRAVGVTSMGESGVLTDADERPLAPVIAWHDDRDRDEVADLAEQHRCRRIRRHRGKAAARPVFADQAPLAAATTNRPAGPRRDASTWQAGWCGGSAARSSLELSLAGRTGWLDVATRDWWDDALDLVRCPSRADAAARTGRACRSAR